LVDTRRGYLETLLKLPKKERLRHRGASFPALQDIFLHIRANNVWGFESVPQNRQDSDSGIQGQFSDSEIRAQARRVEKLSQRLAKSLTPAKLAKGFVVRGIQGNGQPYELRANLRTIIWHTVDEELQHRGEMNALFWQLDVDAPTRAWFRSRLAG
jgi:uncharacterized damage-inducible protein DinB